MCFILNKPHENTFGIRHLKNEFACALFLKIHFQVPIHHFAEHCQRRLEKTMQSGAKRGIRKPSLEEIEQAKVWLVIVHDG